jgi:NodT family efflux transporter outer membrane factor (OMF) lipoprotein
LRGPRVAALQGPHVAALQGPHVAALRVPHVAALRGARVAALLGAGVAAALLGGCAVGPDYRRPVTAPTTAYKEVGSWKPSEPADGLGRGPWWKIFDDATLDGLEADIDVSNQNVKAAVAAYDQARALVDQAKAGFWPTLSASLARTRGSAEGFEGAHTANATTATVSANWSLDIWGQIRRTVESDRDSAQSSGAALAAARLSAQADLATDYFELRAQDQLLNLLDDTVKAQQASLKITQSRYHYGVAAKADVVSAEAQLLTSQAQEINARVQRGILEHAIAVLMGKAPAEFSLAPAPIRADVPVVPPGLPSELLQRRPDVAEAERKVAAANAGIGVATAAYFPSLTLTASDEYSGGPIGSLFRVPNRIWSVGPTLADTLIDFGARRAEVAQARAAYAANVAMYRQTVLAGLQQVEDEIVTLKVLEEQAVVEDEAVKVSKEAELLTLNQYKAGTVPYSSVITAQTTTLSSEQNALTVLSDRLQASVALVEALGGGWNSAELD